mmetsp:Transcript_100359/g.288320  ORF Transcript_100359/g.288320 Transcript_100359/m.288320 type:complete len:491 (+) Transcript_100359:94-1566(+)|eukprot:CAMPEP_0177197638 /NCGR_PEP_ID=MMETSP0367-20130122/24694_1 /TAXON_ID=447022 ORGANISM="Scrippsiella hangoei-like, Strain SHHI-4" /NCGR_SAMPLE_ID=MMETSP0367 /ASSEMBLY_ACC=CAM_ASM_000362 /LENGTH=490 /DNA_ID=CAMNT_0018645827 /DNA_START=28 /DNA_END=1500 /DNA_ORIENTATION=+
MASALEYSIDEAPQKDARGWAMRRGHCKRLRHDDGRESVRGRSAVARSVNRGSRRLGWSAEEVARAQRRAFRTLRQDVRQPCRLEFVHGCGWDVHADIGQHGDEEEVDLFTCFDEDDDRRRECSDINLENTDWLAAVRSSSAEDKDADEDPDDAISTTASSTSRQLSSGGSLSLPLAPPPRLLRGSSAPVTRRDLAEALVGASRSGVPLAARRPSTMAASKLVRASFKPSTPWEIAVGRAARVALSYYGDVSSAFGGKARRARLWANQPNLSACEQEFNRLRASFRRTHEKLLLSRLGPRWYLTPAPMSREAIDRFVSAKELLPDADIRPVYHGTNTANYASIFRQGLLIAGEGTGIKIAHGSAHGHGVYTATAESPATSRGYSNENRLLVCGYLDDGGRAPEVVKCVGAFVVIYQSSRVIPLFTAHGPASPGVGPVLPLNTVLPATPTFERRVRRQERQRLLRQLAKTKIELTAPAAHYARRAARRRRQ